MPPRSKEKCLKGNLDSRPRIQFSIHFIYGITLTGLFGTMCEDNDSDYLDFGGDSEDNGIDSSEDELDVLLQSSPEHRRPLQPKPTHQDDFEQEMNAELHDMVAAIEAQREHSNVNNGTSGPSSTCEANSSNAQPDQFYDDIYFDSDEEGDKESSKGIKKRRIPTNDDLLYDPNMDDDDERWVAKQRQHCRVPGNRPKTDRKRQDLLPQSDAVLDCPACMTTLCRDCQRHDTYENQYRAMFVTSCVVDRTELLKFPEQKGKRRKRKVDVERNDSDEDKYHPVKCEECNTVVAMYDKDEVYHFFNILASY